MNQRLALEVIKALMGQGATEFCICPGARNSPLVELLLQIPTLKRYHFFEERSAAFFALGRIKATGQPVTVVTTSGTAAGELLPATMEAYYSSLPLVLLTADRPVRFRGSGAPQAAEQVGIYGIYVEKCLDLFSAEAKQLSGSLDALKKWSLAKPFHLNVCFEEPLLDHSAAEELREFIAAGAARPSKPREFPAEDMRTNKLTSFLKTTRHPLVVVGALDFQDREATKNFLCQLGAPVYFEAQSGLREDADLAQFRVHSAENILGRAKKSNYPIDGVLRIGGVPTLRLWRDLEALGGKLPVFSLSRTPFSGLSWAPVTHQAIGSYLKNLDAGALTQSHASEVFLDRDLELQKKTRALFFEEPRAEASLFHLLSRAIPINSRIFIGNSLPIREWDLAATFAPRSLEVAASRGLNGIDGQVSTFYGYATQGCENWGVLGDLTALYDLPGPWALSEMSPEIKTRLVVINNGGGKIFSRMFPYKEFQNPHKMDFSAWAKLWKLTYEQWFAVPDLLTQTAQNQIIEIVPDEAATQRFWAEYDQFWKMKANIYCVHGFLGLPSDWDFLPGEPHRIDPFSVVQKHRNPMGDLEDWALAFNESVLNTPQPRILVGYSMGGRLALHALIPNPSLWDAAIFSSTHLGMPEAEREARLKSDEAWASRFETEDWEEVVRAWDENPVFCGKPSPFKRKGLDRIDLAYALRFWSTGHQNDLLPRATELEMPILWVTGQEDRRYSEFSRQIQSRLASKNQQNWSFWEAPGAGHRVPWEAQEGFRKHFSGFLNKVLLGERYDTKI